jgi:hypothetical protein
MELDICHGHGAARNKGRPAGLESDHNENAAQELNHPAEPDLGPQDSGVFGPNSENLLHTMKRKHEAAEDTKQRVGMFCIVCELFHE